MNTKGRHITLAGRIIKWMKINGKNSCWEWTAAVGRDGYGKLNVSINKKHKQLRAHRVSYEQFVGEIPDGLLVLHRCHNRLCVNPDHLYVGTVTDNNRDTVAAGRHRNKHSK